MADSYNLQGRNMVDIPDVLLHAPSLIDEEGRKKGGLPVDARGHADDHGVVPVQRHDRVPSE